jgi:hypothetical protein
MAYHESLGVSIDPPAIAPRLPDTGLYEADPEGSEIALDLERSVRRQLVGLFVVRYHHCVHESY